MLVYQGGKSFSFHIFLEHFLGDPSQQPHRFTLEPLDQVPPITSPRPCMVLSTGLLLKGSQPQKEKQHDILLSIKYWLVNRDFYNKLVGGFNPFEKNARQNGNLPKVGVNIKNI